MKKRKFAAGLLAFCISAAMLFQTAVFAAEETADTAAASAVTTNSISGWPQGPDITSTAAVVMEESTNTILYAKNMDQALYPAAAVKIMTVLLALENSSLTDQVTMTETAASGATDGGANIATQVGEIFTMEQCLYAIMLASANDISLQVAEHIGGSVENFVQLMNTRAAELGCTNTVFTNPTGLPDENQHITAHDMALIMKEAIKNETFCTIAGATSYTIPATNMAGGDRALSTNFTMITNTSDAYYEGCIGGKEGFTQASGSTLVCAAQRNGMTLVCVVLNGASGQTDDEAITLLDYGFGNFQQLSLGEDDFSVVSGGDVIIPNGTGAESVTTEDTETDGQISRQYLFGGTPVGTATLEIVQEEEPSVVINGEENMKAAMEYSASRTYVPYYVIGGVGAFLLVLLIVLMVKVIKK